MLDSKIGYMICETATAEANGVIVSEKNNRVIVEVIFQDMNCKNRNNRFYSDSEMLPALKGERLVELLTSGNLYGENGHPLSKDLARQQTIDPNNRCHKVLKLWVDGNDIKAHVKGANGAIGQEFNDDILDGDLPSFSLRALGSVKNTSRGTEVENLTIVTWDRVIYPSHKRAYMQNIVNVSESASLMGQTDLGNKLVLEENDSGLLVPITNKSVIDYIKTESCNLNIMKESMDLLYDSVTILENRRQVQLQDKQGGIYVINLEKHIQNELMNYCNR